MNLLLKILLFTSSILFVFACSSKINPSLKRKAIIHASIEPIFNQPKEISNYFNLGLNVTLNNGKTKREFFQNNEKTNSSFEIDEYEKDCYWENFEIITYNCQFKNGRVYFSRNDIKTPDYIAIKINSKNGYASDSIYIKIPKITAVKIEYKTNTTLSPNFAVPFNINAYFNNGEKITIDNRKAFDAFAGNYIIKIQGKTVNYPYSYQIPNEAEFQSSFFVSCNHIKDTLLHDSITIPLKYDGHYRFLYKGIKGQNGENGADAYRTLNNRSGENGQKGRNGQRGEPAPRVYVILKSFVIDSTLYIKAIAYSNETVNSCIINPKFGKLTISNVGGDGGNGGEGGQAANGEHQTERYAAGSGGSGGEGGDGGDGNKGGSIKVYADSTAALFFNRIELLNPGGYGGSGGRGGKNGLSGNEKNSNFGSFMAQSLLKSIFPGRGSSGMNGYSGENGEEPSYEIIDKKAIEQMEQRILNK